MHVIGQQVYLWFDDYNWHKNTSFFGGLVTGEQMQQLKTLGSAKDFKMVGDWSGTVSGTIPLNPGGGLGKPNLKWVPRHISPGP